MAGLRATIKFQSQAIGTTGARYLLLRENHYFVGFFEA